MQKLSCKALTLTAAAVVLGGGLFFAQPQVAEAKLLPADYEEKQAALMVDSAEPQGTVEIPAQLTGESREITLDEAMELAMANSPTVLSAENDLQAAKISASQANSTSRSAKQAVQVHLPAAMATNWSGKAMLEDQTYYAATFYGPEATKKGVELRTYAKELQENLCKLQTIQGYYTVLCDEQSEHSAEMALEKARNQQNVVQSRLEQGMATKLELLQANTQVNGAQTALDAARAKTVQDKRSLNVVMGLSPDTNWSPSSQLTFEPYPVVDVEAKVQEMVADSPMVKITKATLELAELTRDNDMVTKPIMTYDGKTAQLTYETAEITYNNQQRVAYTNAKSMLESLSLAREQYLIYQESQELLEEVYRLAVLQYENGLNTQNDIQAAAADLASNDSSRLNALLQYNVAKTAIEQGIVQTGSAS